MALLSFAGADQQSHLAAVQVVDVNRSARAEDAQRVARLTRGVRHRHRGAEAAAEFQQRDRRVFHVSSEDRIRNEAADALDSAEEVEQDFEPMTSEVEHRSAAGVLFPDEPRARVIGRRIERFERVDLHDDRIADVAGRDHLFDARDDRIEVAVVGHAEPDAVGAARGDDAIALGDRHRHRLLAEHVLTGVGGGNRLRRMQMNGRRDVDGVDLAIGDQFLPARVPPPRAERGRERFGELGPRAADRDELARPRVAQRGRDALACEPC